MKKVIVVCLVALAIAVTSIASAGCPGWRVYNSGTTTQHPCLRA